MVLLGFVIVWHESDALVVCPDCWLVLLSGPDTAQLGTRPPQIVNPVKSSSDRSVENGMERSRAEFVKLEELGSGKALRGTENESKTADPPSYGTGGLGGPGGDDDPHDSVTERRALINEPNEQFGDNTIRTSKYTALSFIPRSLFEQFRRTANVYFLVISLFMIVGTYAPQVFQSPLQPYSTLGPLILVLAISMIKEAIEDWKRHVSDREVNYRKISVLRTDGTEEQVRWIDLRVGHVIRVVNKGEVPADVILLQTSEPQGMCYIETSNIDGETNLKIKEAVPAAAKALPTSSHIASARGAIVYEQPNDSIHTFDGVLKLSGHESMPIAASNMLLRGCTVRNTHWVLGLVAFTGADTKVMKKSAGSRSKMSRIETIVNRCIGIIFATQLLLCIISTILERHWSRTTGEDAPYLHLLGSSFVIPIWLADLLTFFVLYNNFIPISLYVTIEIVNFVQAGLVDKDRDMYDPETGTQRRCVDVEFLSHDCVYMCVYFRDDKTHLRKRAHPI